MSSSRLFDDLVAKLQVMPGIGPVSATRIAYQLLDRKRDQGLKMAESITAALSHISRCPSCGNYTDEEGQECVLCASPLRRHSKLLCVVEYPADVEAIEKTQAFTGRYFVLHGRLSPIDGVGPAELNFPKLEQLMQDDELEEVILAVSQTVEGDATAQYLGLLCRKYRVKATRIASGMPIGGELEHIDSHTLISSLAYRREL